MKVHNFSAGPAILPQEVLQGAAEAIANFSGTNLSILEVSHRSKEFEAVVAESEALTKELLGVSEQYHVLFLQGGASTQFSMVPMNFLGDGEKAGYVDTGAWSSKAIKEAKRYGDLAILASSKESNYSYIPKGFQVPQGLKYVHITTNNTIFGTEYRTDPPAIDAPYVADMSSDFFSRPINISQYGLIYAGAQKNIGPAGATIVIIDKDFMERTSRDVPSMMNYKLHVENQSMYNTPPVFSIYVCMLTLRWIKKLGGLSAMKVRNEIKANTLYDTIDRSSLFYGTAAIEDRSLMNVTFLLKDPELEAAFLSQAKAANISGIKGHRSVGGFRASIYNAMEMDSIHALCELIQTFDKQHG